MLCVEFVVSPCPCPCAEDIAKANTSNFDSTPRGQNFVTSQSQLVITITIVGAVILDAYYALLAGKTGTIQCYLASSRRSFSWGAEQKKQHRTERREARSEIMEGEP